MFLHKNIFASYDALIGNGKKYSDFQYIPINFLHCVLQTLIELEYVERTKTHYRSNSLRQENGGKLWFIILCAFFNAFLTPVIVIKVDSAVELVDRAVIVACKDTMTTMQE